MAAQMLRDAALLFALILMQCVFAMSELALVGSRRARWFNWSTSSRLIGRLLACQ
jgi:hypothetical protein